MCKRIFVLFLLLLVTAAACKKSDKPAADKQVTAAPTSGTPAAAPSAANPTAAAGEPESGANDYSKPTLTEAKIQGYIKAMKDGHNPFEVVGAAAGMLNGKESISKAQAVVDEQEVIAKKYGFANAQDYMDTAGRIMVGQVQLGANESMVQMRDMMAKTIADYEKQLSNPSLSAEEKTSLSESLAESKKSLAEMDSGSKDGQLNAADLELVKKFKTEIEAADKANAEILKAKKK